MKHLREKLASLTPREREVLDLVIEGKLSKEIAYELGISERTIKHHRGQILRKMGARHAIELIDMAYSLGLKAVNLVP